MTICQVLRDECVAVLGADASELTTVILNETKEARHQQDTRLDYYRRISLTVGAAYFFFIPLTIAAVEQKALIGAISILLGVPIIVLVALIHVDTTRWSARKGA